MTYTSLHLLLLNSSIYYLFFSMEHQTTYEQESNSSILRLFICTCNFESYKFVKMFVEPAPTNELVADWNRLSSSMQFVFSFVLFVPINKTFFTFHGRKSLVPMLYPLPRCMSIPRLSLCLNITKAPKSVFLSICSTTETWKLER